MSSAEQILAMIQDNNAKFVDLRFTDTHGKEQHMSLPASAVDEAFFVEGKLFDGSSMAGWKGINESDMIIMPDTETAVVDPFCKDVTVNLRCDVIEPNTMRGYERDPRSIAKRAETYLQETGIAHQALFGPEPEFFLFDDVRWSVEMQGSFYQVDSSEAVWNSGRFFEGGNMGHRPDVKSGYFPVPPIDSSQEIRSAMCHVLENMGMTIEAHHHEVATANQNEISTRFNSLTRKADELQILKYVVHNVAHQFGKTATFMPKPVVGDNGSGMHVHQSLLSADGDNLFSGVQYAHLSQQALWYIGGIIHHAKAINAFANASTNSYKRLVPGFEAPVLLAYSAKNRSASIRIPYTTEAKKRRIEVRFPDATANPYLAFSAMLMAGIDGIQRQLDPGLSMDRDLYALDDNELQGIDTVATSLSESLIALDGDRDFLKQGNVFSDQLIDAYIELKQEQVRRLRMTTHPVEFAMYYSC